MSESWKLLELRARITRIDTQLVALIAERCAVAADIQRLKKIIQLPAEDPQREAAVLHQVRALAADFDLDAEFIAALWRQLFAHARRLDGGQGEHGATR